MMMQIIQNVKQLFEFDLPTESVAAKHRPRFEHFAKRGINSKVKKKRT